MGSVLLWQWYWSVITCLTLMPNSTASFVACVCIPGANFVKCCHLVALLFCALFSFFTPRAHLNRESSCKSITNATVIIFREIIIIIVHMSVTLRSGGNNIVILDWRECEIGGRPGPVVLGAPQIPPAVFRKVTEMFHLTVKVWWGCTVTACSLSELSVQVPFWTHSAVRAYEQWTLALTTVIHKHWVHTAQ